MGAVQRVCPASPQTNPELGEGTMQALRFSAKTASNFSHLNAYSDMNYDSLTAHAYPQRSHPRSKAILPGDYVLMESITDSPFGKQIRRTPMQLLAQEGHQGREIQGVRVPDKVTSDFVDLLRLKNLETGEIGEILYGQYITPQHDTFYVGSHVTTDGLPEYSPQGRKGLKESRRFYPLDIGLARWNAERELLTQRLYDANLRLQQMKDAMGSVPEILKQAGTLLQQMTAQQQPASGAVTKAGKILQTP